MKKLLLLLCAMLTLGVSGAWAQVTTIEDGGTYVIRFHKNSNFVSPTMNTTKVSAGRFRFDKVGTEGSYDVYTIYSVNDGKYLSRTAAPTNGGTTTNAETNDDSDNFKWTVATSVNSSNSDASIWTISPYGYATSETKYVLTGWTDSFNESNVLKFYDGTGHDLAQLKIGKYADALNDLSATACYNITNPRGWWDVASGATVVNSTVETSLATSYADPKQQFAFVQHDGKYYLYSVSEKKFAYVDGKKLSLTSCFSSAVASSNVTFVASTYTNASQYPVVITIGGQNFGVSTSYSPDIYAYTSTNDQGNGSLIVEAGSFDPTEAQAQITNTVNVTYHLMYNGSEVKTASSEALSGEALAPIPSSIDNGFMTYTYYSDEACTSELTVVPANGAVYVKATWNGPFEISTNFTSAKWYYVQLRAKWLKYENSSISGVEDQVTADGGQWAFMGNPYTGLQVVNKAAGDGKYLTYSGTTLQFGETATNWTIAKHPSTYVDGFWIYYHDGTNYHTPYAGSDGGVTALSNTDGLTSSNDGNSSQGGGAWVLTAVPEDYYDLVEANILPYLNDAADNTPFKVPTSTASGMLSTINSAHEQGAISLADYNSLLTSLNSYIKYPATGYYRMKNYSTQTYAGATTGTARLIADGAYAASTIVYLTKSADANSYTIQVQGQYLSTPAQYTDVTLTNTSLVFTPAVAAPGYASLKAAETGLYGYIGIDGDKNLEGAAATGIDANPAAYWAFEPATTVTIPMNVVGGKSYATMYLPFDVTLPSPTASSGAVVNLVTIEGERAKLTQAGYNTKVAAGTPVLLYSPYGDTSLTATIGAVTDGVSGDNALQGTYVEKTTLEDNEYIFGTRSDELGFWKLGEGKKVGANKAYLVYDGAEADEVKGFSLSFDFETAVEAVENAPQTTGNEPVYNLAGQRVSQPARGLYIIGGRKVVIK